MERLKFLGIYSSNMDEFFKVRVASIQRRFDLGERAMGRVLEIIGDRTRDLDDRFQAAYADITGALADAGTWLLSEADFAAHAKGTEDWLRDYFRTQVLPMLVPIVLEDNRPFPPLTDGAVYFAVQMTGAVTRYAVLEIPSELPRFVQLPNGHIMYIDDVVRYSLRDVFYIFDFERIEAFEFKISRDAELDIDNDFNEGYVRKMERVLRQRKGGRPTRLAHDDQMPEPLIDMLMRRLNILEDDTVIGGGRYHNMKDLIKFPNRHPGMNYPPMRPARHPVLDGARSMFDVIRKQDVLITYPYQSFDHVTRLLREAAIDPEVEEIMITLYRVARNSHIVNALCNAARNGKDVFVSIELQARFDEKNNISVSERLSEAGATVVYGIPPMKVHSKLLMIRRGEELFAAFSTGNFNEVTGNVYVDSTLLTCDPRMTSEVERVFDLLEEASRMRILRPPSFSHLLVSPFNSRRTILSLIAAEKAKGRDGYIMMKLNHLTDDRIIRALRQAADAGVRMDLIVRTTYAMRPHPNIRAISLVDRFLEHQRVYLFGRGETQRVFMSSSDLMERNLDWRVEVTFPVYDPALKRQVADMMEFQIRDNCKARILDETQSNPYVSAEGPSVQAQQETYHYLLRLEPTVGQR